MFDGLLIICGSAMVVMGSLICQYALTLQERCVPALTSTRTCDGQAFFLALDGSALIMGGVIVIIYGIHSIFREDED